MIKTLVILVLTTGTGQSATDSMIKFEGETALVDCQLTKSALIQAFPDSNIFYGTRYTDENIKCVVVR